MTGQLGLDRYVASIDASTGHVVARQTIAGVPAVIGHQGSSVWVVGGGDGAEPRATVSVLDDTTLRVLTEYTARDEFGAYDLAFVGDDAWVTSPGTGELVRFRLVDGRIEERRFPFTSVPQEVFAVGGELWVRDTRWRGLVLVDPANGSGVQVGSWSGGLAGAPRKGRVWGTTPNGDGTWRLERLGPSRAAGSFPVVTKRLALPAYASAATTRGAGLCAATETELMCWTGAEVAAEAAPSARTALPATIGHPSSILAWSDSSLWIVAGRTLLRWPFGTAAASVATPTTAVAPFVTPSDPRLARVREMGGVTDATLPSGWLRCVNSIERFSVGAPADWYTATVGAYPASPGSSGLCSLFDSEPFHLDSEVTADVMLQFPLGEALPPTEFDTAVALLRTSCCNVIEQRTAVVDGRRAEFTVYTTREGVFAGVTWACYTIDREGEAFSACTIASPTSPTYSDRIAMLDQVVATLRFD